MLYLEGWTGITGPHPSPKSLTCWTNDLHGAGYRPRRLKFPQELNGYVFKTKAGHLDGGHRLWSGMERDGLRHATLPKTHHMKMTITTQSIPARSSPGTRTAPSVASHQDGGEKGRTTTIQGKAGKCFTAEQDILKTWTEFCSELYTHNNRRSQGARCPSTNKQ